MDLVTIKTFDNVIGAHILKSKLESENIICFLFDENIVGLNPLYNIAVGGIKLKVNKIDIEKAAKIIDDSSKSILTNEYGEEIKCSRCQSKNIYSGFKSMKGTKGLLAAILSFLFMVFPIYYKTVYKCKSCEYEFK